MNFDITLEDLQSIGINPQTEQVETTLSDLNNTLNERIGVEITEALTDEQLDEMMTVKQSGDKDALASWMSANIPELEDIVSDERDILLGELADRASE